MYGLPKDFNGSFFLGRNLEMICFTLNQVYFHFDEGLILTVEGKLSYQELSFLVNYEPPIKEANLMQLIGHSISKVDWDEKGTLTISFDNNQNLEIFDNLPNYECYQITYKGKTIIV